MLFACHADNNIITSAGDVDGPLEVLLPENKACCPGLGLCVSLPLPLQAHCRRDKVPLLGPDRQEKWNGTPHIQRHFSVLRRGTHKCYFVTPSNLFFLLEAEVEFIPAQFEVLVFLQSYLTVLDASCFAKSDKIRYTN